MSKYRRLSKLEVDVLRMLAEGYIIKETADAFGTTPESVGRATRRIRRCFKIPAHIELQAILPILALNMDKLVKFRRLPKKKATSLLPMTPKQALVCKHFALGLRQSEIAKILNLSPSTIEDYMVAIRRHVAARLRKESVTDQEIVHFAVALGMIEIRFVELLSLEEEVRSAATAAG